MWQRSAGSSVFRLWALLIVLLACGRSGPTVFAGHGIVHDVRPEWRQTLIEHDAIPGLMPAMTMSFDVRDDALLERLSAGQVIDFRIEVSKRHYRLLDFEVVGEATPEQGWARLGDTLVRADPAPDFKLRDQAGRPFSLSDLRGHAVLLDFIYTRCPGPCPILTGQHAALWRSLSAALRERVRFVSISLDPVHDDPAALAAYARARGADQPGWFFATGAVAEVERVTRAFGVGHTRAEDGRIEHSVVSFVIDPRGMIVGRYFGLEHAPQELASDLENVAGIGGG